MSITVLTRLPAPNDQVERGVDLFIAAYCPEGFAYDHLRLEVNDVVAYDGQRTLGTPDPVAPLSGFVVPEWNGELTGTANYLGLRVRSRRAFDAYTSITVRTTLRTADDAPLSTLVDTFSFYVAPATRLPTGSKFAMCQRRFALPFPLAALDQYRQILGTTLVNDPRWAAVAVASCIVETPLRPLLGVLQIAPPAPPPNHVRNALVDTDSYITRFTGLWETSLRELRGLGVGPQTVETLRRSMASGYAANRVGAVCGAVLLGAAFLDAQGQ